MKAYQRIVRDENSKNSEAPTVPDIKKATLKEITYADAEHIITQYEWLGTMARTKYHYGILFDGILAGVVCFGPFMAWGGNTRKHPYADTVGENYCDRGIELSRGACTWWAHEHSGSKLIAYGLKEVSKRGYKYAVAFSDYEAGEIGTLYQATNWYYIGCVNRKHVDIYYKKTGRVFLNSREISKKYHMTTKRDIDELIKNNPLLEAKEIMPKGRYIKLLGSYKENREMFDIIKNKIISYPKRESIETDQDYIKITQDKIIETNRQLKIF